MTTVSPVTSGSIGVCKIEIVGYPISFATKSPSAKMASTSAIKIAFGAISLYSSSNKIALDELDPIKPGRARMVLVIDVPQSG